MLIGAIQHIIHWYSHEQFWKNIRVIQPPSCSSIWLIIRIIRGVKNAFFEYSSKKFKHRLYVAFFGISLIIFFEQNFLLLPLYFFDIFVPFFGTKATHLVHPLGMLPLEDLIGNECHIRISKKPNSNKYSNLICSNSNIRIEWKI